MSGADTQGEADAHPYRMRDLCAATGLDRQTIHFYIQQGLLPPGHKTGRNMAWYGEAHLERLRLIQQLQQERFLPLKAIKAIFEGREKGFAPEQALFLGRVKARLGASLAAPERQAREEAASLVRRLGLPAEDLAEAIAIGMIGTQERDGTTYVVAGDVWMLELVAQLRGAGFTRDRGFTIADVRFYEEAVRRLFGEEMALIFDRLTDLPPEEVATMIERALPVLHTFLARFHAERFREFFGTL
ncbi:MAG: MerR family transcriptional regulator [Myxococcota bacterium]